MKTEIEQIADRYARRTLSVGERYARLRPEIVAGVQERQRALAALLRKQSIAELSKTTVLEVGCGAGSNLLELLLLGAHPENLAGNELLPERLHQARRMLPEAVRLHSGDASTLQFAPDSFDIVYQSTMFSSILDDTLQQHLAECMWRWVRPGGGVLWYDFIYNNPSNPDVRGIPLKRVRQLFPDGKLARTRVTLAPPISRRVTRVHPALYGVFNLLPILRSHVLCFIQKK
ncbi:MAG: class I SAM-dependent methyltransferase [Pseudomonadota bacterium]